MTAFERPEVRAVARLLPPLLRRHVRPFDRSAEPVARPAPRTRCHELGDPRPGQADVACGERLRGCALHGVCTTGTPRPEAGGRCCATCGDHTDLPPKVNVGSLVVRFDRLTLWPDLPGERFNASILPDRDGYLFAVRNGWRGSEIYAGRLDREFRPVGPAARLNLWHREANYGREDPRLFRFRGRPHVAYIGVVGGHTIRHTNQMYARLTDDGMAVEEVFAPVDYPPGRAKGSRGQWQKNWGFFEHEDQLFAVYSVAPHQVLRLDGSVAELAHITPTPAPWESAAEMRGGAAPVRVGDEWYHFFHSKRESGGRLRYEMGCYVFDARPPFRIRRITPRRLIDADPATNPGNYCDCFFPCGAVLDGGRWVIAAGIHDRWTELHALDAAEVDRRMTPIAPPGWWSHREQWADPGIWRHVVELDEYRLAGVDLSGGVALDIGAHVGTFAFRAKERGAAVVHCYEPWDQSADLLERNAARLPGVRVFREAVGGPVATFGRFTGLTHAGNTGSGNVTLDPDGDIPVVPLDEAIRRAAVASPDGRVAVLKIDAEGAEGPALEGATLLGLVDRIAMEWHPPYSAAWATALLTAAGFSVETLQGEDGRGLAFAHR